MLGAQAATLGELGHHFPPPPAFPRMLQQSWCQEPRAIWKRSWTAARDPLETKPSISAALSEEAPALPCTPTVGSAHPWPPVGVRAQEGQAGTCCKGQQGGSMGSASLAEPGPGRHRNAPPGCSLLPKNSLESLTWKRPWELSVLQALLCWGVSEG